MALYKDFIVEWYMTLQRNFIVDNMASISECHAHNLCKNDNCFNQVHMSWVDYVFFLIWYNRILFTFHVYMGFEHFSFMMKGLMCKQSMKSTNMFFYFSIAYVNLLWIKEYFCLTFVFPIDSPTLHLLLVDVEITTLVRRGVSCWWHIRPSKYGIGNINVEVALDMNVKLLTWKSSHKLVVSNFFILVFKFFIIFIQVNGIL